VLKEADNLEAAKLKDIYFLNIQIINRTDKLKIFILDGS